MKIRHRDPSARTSFALSPQALSAMEWLVERLGSPKETFSFILQMELLDDLKRRNVEALLLQRLRDWSAPRDSTRKSFVIGTAALKRLNDYARRKKIRRDALVDFLVLSHKKYLEEAHRELYEKQRKAQALLQEFWDSALAVEGKIGGLLGKEDPIYLAFSEELRWLEDRVLERVEDLLKEGEPITEVLGRVGRTAGRL